MKTLDNLINKPLPTPDQQQDELQRQQTQREERLLNRNIITDLWELMARLYGHKWTSSYGAQIDPGNIWAASLKGLTQEQIRAGFAFLVQQGYEWPPSAPEFRKLCDDDGSWERQAHKPFRRDRALEDKGAKERAGKAGKEHLEIMKGLF